MALEFFAHIYRQNVSHVQWHLKLKLYMLHSLWDFRKKTEEQKVVNWRVLCLPKLSVLLMSSWFVTPNEHDNWKQETWNIHKKDNSYIATLFYTVTKASLVLLIYSHPHVLDFSDFLCLHSVSLLQVGAFARKNTCAAAGFVGGFLLGLASS